MRRQRRDANPVAATRYVVRRGKPVALPTSPRAFLTTPAFTLGAKLRLLREPFVARGPAGVEESVGAFVRRRLGSEFLDYAIDPFVAGIYGGDPERISVSAAFPRLLALEQKYGSLIKGQILGARERRRNKEAAKNAAASFSFRGGMQTLTDALARALAPIVYDVSAHRVARDAGRHLRDRRHARRRAVRAPCAHGRALRSGPSHRSDDPGNGRRRRGGPGRHRIRAARDRRQCVPPPRRRAFARGLRIPRAEEGLRSILGCLFSSSMFDGRAPDGTVLLTRSPAADEIRKSRRRPTGSWPAPRSEELADLVGAAQRPLWQEVVRWPQAIPQYDLGHLARLRRIDAAEAAVPGLYFCANYRGGVAVGDRIRCGHAMAEQVDAFLKGGEQVRK